MSELDPRAAGSSGCGDPDCDCPPAQVPDGAIVRELPIVNRKGLHARATAKFVQCAESFDAAIQVTRCGETVGGTSIMGILTLGAGIGTTITVAATGAQAQQAIDALAALVANRFGEEE
ncbi:HPr family phosphocarrier protein [Alsobacter sp. SYSU M60028]|uniref:HPr family phosphocarrier protein n=1 Tax=Alsobacter ponti TaxID=2962936 RepID=A0ABT1LGH3_9HYPH|nr:HPr family phosphocarrier protein [Alsobacter ponti]MCP8940549.1 HPr family phosphocarrier protein [Alsobacter ponti]